MRKSFPGRAGGRACAHKKFQLIQDFVSERCRSERGNKLWRGLQLQIPSLQIPRLSRLQDIARDLAGTEPCSEPSGASALSHPPFPSKTRSKRVRNHYLSPQGHGFIFIFPHEILALNEVITNC